MSRLYASILPLGRRGPRFPTGGPSAASRRHLGRHATQAARSYVLTAALEMRANFTASDTASRIELGSAIPLPAMSNAVP